MRSVRLDNHYYHDGVPGVFIRKGWGVGISDLSISVDENGEVRMSPAILTHSLQLWPLWFETACEHTGQAVDARRRLLAAVEVADNESIGAAIEDEIRHGMAAIAANAFVWDNVYEIVRSKLTELPTFAPRTARWKRIDQILQRGFRLNDEARSMMRTVLGDLFPLRDWAVHPRSDHEHSVQFAAIDRGVPVMHYRFRAENAANATNATWVIAELHRVTRGSEAAVAEWAQDVADRLPEQRPEWDVPGDFHLPEAPLSDEE